MEYFIGALGGALFVLISQAVVVMFAILFVRKEPKQDEPLTVREKQLADHQQLIAEEWDELLSYTGVKHN